MNNGFKLRGYVNYCLTNIDTGKVLKEGRVQNRVTDLGLLWIAQRLYYDKTTFSAPGPSASVDWVAADGHPIVEGFPNTNDVDNNGSSNANRIIAMALGGATGIPTGTSDQLVGEYYGSTLSGTTTWFGDGATGSFASFSVQTGYGDTTGYTFTQSRQFTSTSISYETNTATFKSTFGPTIIAGSSPEKFIGEVGLFTSQYYKQGVMLCYANLASRNIYKGLNDSLDITWTITTV